MNREVSFGRWVQQRRKALDLTQEELARRVGCAAVTIQKIETGQRRPSKQIAERLAICLNVPPSEQPAFVERARGALRNGSDASSTPASQPASRHHLPAPPTSLIGRDETVATLRTLLGRDGVRLVTLVGAPGIGKTRLGLQVATELQAQFAGGVAFVPLAPIRDPELVPSAIAQVLGVQETAGQTLLDSLKHFLGSKQVLLVSDNFEQILPGGMVVSELLTAAPRLKVLVTSREGLHLYGEHEFPVPPLALPDLDDLPPIQQLRAYAAVDLFVQRAQAVQPDFQLTQVNAAAIAELCVRLDGLPLAIELAAARIKLLTPQEMLSRLESRLDWLTDGPRDLPPRHQALRATIEWSYHLLNEGEKTLFRRLGVFVGGFALEAAEVVCNSNGDLPMGVLDGLASLLNKSLLRQHEGAGGEPRFMMLETILDYAREQLELSGEQAAMQDHHLSFFVRLAEEADPILESGERWLWVERLEAEHDNLRAALRRACESGQAEWGMRMVRALRSFWYIRGNPSEGRAWCEQVLRVADEVDGPWPLDSHSSSYLQTRADALFALSSFAWIQGDSVGGQAVCQESLAISRQIGYQRGISRALTGIAMTASMLGERDLARSSIEEALALARQINYSWDTPMLLMCKGFVLRVQGDHDAARLALIESEALWRERRDIWGQSLVLLNLGDILQQQGDSVQAMNYLEEAIPLLKAVGDLPNYAIGLRSLAAAMQAQGNTRRAEELLKESLALGWEIGDRRGMVECLLDLTSVRGVRAQPEWAARLLGAATMLLEATGGQFDPKRQVEYERSIAALHEQLGEATFEAAWAEGQAMTLEGAVAYALEEA